MFDSGLYVNILCVFKYKSKYMEIRFGECKENFDIFICFSFDEGLLFEM